MIVLIISALLWVLAISLWSLNDSKERIQRRANRGQYRTKL